MFQYFDNFVQLTEKEKKEINKICTLVRKGKNEILQPIGSSCTTIYFVKSGLARIYYSKDDVDVTEIFAGQDSILARVESLFNGKPSNKGIQTLEPSEFIAINYPALFTLYDKYPRIERLFRLIFELEHVHVIQRLENFLFLSAEERYTQVVKHTDLLSKVSLKHIASYLGITQVSLSRIRAGYKDQ